MSNYKYVIIIPIILLSIFLFASLSCLHSLFCGEDYAIENISNDTTDSHNPDIAIDSRGTTHAVWNDGYPGVDRIYYTYKKKDSVWSNIQQISNDPNRDSRSPCIFITTNNIYVAWSQHYSYCWNILYISKNLDGEWSIPETIFNNTIVGNPRMTIDDNGNVHLVCAKLMNTLRYDILYAKRSPNGIWTEPISLSPAKYSWHPEITADRNGNVHVIWLEEIIHEPLAKRELFYTMKPAGNDAWTIPVRITSTNGMVSLFSYRMTIDDDNNLHVIYKSLNVDHPPVPDEYIIRTPNGNWSSPIIIDTGNTTIGDFLADENKLHHLWFEYGYNNDLLLYSDKETNDSIWSKPLVINNERLSPVWVSCRAAVNQTTHKICMVGESHKEIYYIEIKLRR